MSTILLLHITFINTYIDIYIYVTRLYHMDLRVVQDQKIEMFSFVKIVCVPSEDFHGTGCVKAV